MNEILNRKSISRMLDIQDIFLFVNSAEVNRSGRGLEAIAEFTKTNSFADMHLAGFQKDRGISIVPGTLAFEFALQSAALLIASTRTGGYAIVSSSQVNFIAPVSLGPTRAMVSITKEQTDLFAVSVVVSQAGTVKVRCSALYKYKKLKSE